MHDPDGNGVSADMAALSDEQLQTMLASIGASVTTIFADTSDDPEVQTAQNPITSAVARSGIFPLSQITAITPTVCADVIKTTTVMLHDLGTTYSDPPASGHLRIQGLEGSGFPTEETDEKLLIKCLANIASTMCGLPLSGTRGIRSEANLLLSGIQTKDGGTALEGGFVAQAIAITHFCQIALLNQQLRTQGRHRQSSSQTSFSTQH